MIRLAIIKPDYKIRGGFEIVLDRISQGLSKRGFYTKTIPVDMTQPAYSLGSLSIPPAIYHAHPEFFQYTTAIDKFRRLNVKGYDLVMPTQPPSFAVEHPRTVPLFYHHLKVYYDLYEVYKDTGLAPDIDHALTRDLIHEIDGLYLTDEKTYIAGSAHVAERLRRFSGIMREIFTFSAGIDDDYYAYDGPIRFEDPICVGRHEFPKRPELFVHAMKHCAGLNGKIVGEGGRTQDLKWVDRYLTQLHRQGEDIEDEPFWKRQMFQLNSLKKTSLKAYPSNVEFMGRLSQDGLMKAYAEALCVVCPAYEEDYGLTALEAMAFRKPVICCMDGGGYTEFIRDGYNGFIVEPTGRAIADAVQTLKDNPVMLRQMSDNAYDFSRAYNWTRALDGLGARLTDIRDKA